jgi:hypothetical protein
MDSIFYQPQHKDIRSLILEYLDAKDRAKSRQVSRTMNQWLGGSTAAMQDKRIILEKTLNELYPNLQYYSDAIPYDQDLIEEFSDYIKEILPIIRYAKDKKRIVQKILLTLDDLNLIDVYDFPLIRRMLRRI